MKHRLLVLVALVTSLSPVRADTIDEVIADLRSGDPAKLNARLSAPAWKAGDARIIAALWELVIGEDRFARIKDPSVKGFHEIDLKRLARECLATCQGDLAGLALQHVASADPASRREAALLLSKLDKPVPGTVAELDRGLRSDYPAVREASISALGKQGDEAVGPLLKHLKKVAAEPDYDEFGAVTQTLGGMGTQARKILPDLTGYLDLEKYSAEQVAMALSPIEVLGRAGEAPARNWDLVLPALKRLERQSKGVLHDRAKGLAAAISRVTAAEKEDTQEGRR